MTPRPELKLVDPATGEVVDHDPRVQALQDQLDGAHKEIQAWRARYANLKRDRTKEAREHPEWPEAVELFAYWKQRCGHPRSEFTIDRFELCEPFLSKHGLELCKRAIDGAAFDPFVTRRKNGSVKRHDDFGLIFRDAGKYEDFVNRAPRS